MSSYTISQIYAKALYDPRPTKTSTSQKQLAYALGYPMDWKVERNVIEEVVDEKKKRVIIKDRIHALGGKRNQTKYMWLHHEAAQKAAARFAVEGTLDPTITSTETGAVEIPNSKKSDTTASANINNTGSHLLTPTALYSKGDIVQVNYDDEWWSATVLKKPKKKNGDEFFYSVLYHGDNATQDDVEEIDMRPGEDPAELAVTLGFDITWLASRKGSRYTITSPDEYIFNSKAAAMKHFKNLLKKAAKDSNNNGDGTSAAAKKRKKKEDDKKAAEISSNDPPWRLDGHTLIGRKILYTFQHKASARRQIKIEQYGTIEGYIDESDTDKVRNKNHFE
ncbi:MAG: hypothetical protein ACI8RD_006954 [Bacillariaceae sp.]|jgi:hypothetical protein